MAPRRGVWSWLFTGLILALGVVLGRYGLDWLALSEGRRSSPDVISQIRDLSRLEGASYHVERVIDLQVEQRAFGLVPANDAILLVASGEIIAGVDLGKLRPEDVVVTPDRRSVSIRLPGAEVFSARLDNTRTYVHTRKTDLLAQRNEALETAARQQAERTLQSAAEEAGIVQRAEENVARTVRTLLRSLGYPEVHVHYRAGV